MRDRAPSSNNRRPAPGALPRVPARAGADPHLAATLRCGAGRGASNPAGNGSRAGRAAGQRRSLYLQTRIQSTARTQAPLAPSRAGQCLAVPRACPAPAARPHGTAGPSPGACSGSAPTPGTASSLLCLGLLHRCARASCTALPGLGGAQLTAPGPHGLQAPAPRRAGAEQQPPACSGCWGPAAPTPHSRLPPDAGCPCCASPFPFCIPGRGASALRACLLLKPLRAGEGSYRTPAPLSCLPGAVLGAAHHLAPPRLRGEGETEPTRSRGAGSPPQCQPWVGAGLGRRRAPSSPGTRQPGGGRGKAALLGLKLGKAGGGRGEVPGLPAGERGS